MIGERIEVTPMIGVDPRSVLISPVLTLTVSKDDLKKIGILFTKLYPDVT